MNYPGLNYDFRLEVRNLDHYRCVGWEWEVNTEDSQVATCWLSIQDEPYSEEVQANLQQLSQEVGDPIEYCETNYRLTLVFKSRLCEHELAYKKGNRLLWIKYPTPELVEKARQWVLATMSE